MSSVNLQSGATIAPAEPRLVDEHMAAAILCVSVKTLRRWRWAGRELPFIKIGTAVRYDTADLYAYIARQRRTCTRQAARILQKGREAT